MTNWGGYAGWTGGVELDPFGHRKWLRERLPALSSVYAEAKAAEDAPQERHPAAARVREAIATLRSRGISSRMDLVRWLADGVEEVESGRAGFNLAAPAMAVRIFYGGPLHEPGHRDVPGHPDNEKHQVFTRHVAETVAARLNSPQAAPPVTSVTLERLPDARTVDRLQLFSRDMRPVLQRQLNQLADERPELAERIRGENGKPDLRKFAGIVWRDGLSRQYAREAGGEVVAISPAPFEGQTMNTVELPELIDNDGVVHGEIVCMGFTHEQYTIEQAVVDNQREAVARDQATAAGLQPEQVRDAGQAARHGARQLPAPDDRPYSYREAVDSGRMPRLAPSQRKSPTSRANAPGQRRLQLAPAAAASPAQRPSTHGRMTSLSG